MYLGKVVQTEQSHVRLAAAPYLCDRIGLKNTRVGWRKNAYFIMCHSILIGILHVSVFFEVSLASSNASALRS